MITLIPGRGDETTTATLRDGAIQASRDDVEDSIFNSLDALLEQWARENYITLDQGERRKGVNMITKATR